MDTTADARQLRPQWDMTLIAASIGISLLGAFTSTQLMCQAKTSRHFAGVLVWTALGSLTFGFCSIWSLHEVAMLAYGLDLRIGIDVGLTIVSAILAVVFTFVALASDMLYDRYCRRRGMKSERTTKRRRRTRSELADTRTSTEDGSTEPLLPLPPQSGAVDQTQEIDLEQALTPVASEEQQRPSIAVIQNAATSANAQPNGHVRRKESTNVDPAQPSLSYTSGDGILAEAPTAPMMHHRDSQISMTSQGDESEIGADTESFQDSGSQQGMGSSRRSSSYATSSTTGLGGLLGIKRSRNSSHLPTNPFIATYVAVRAGLTVSNIIKGFFWAIAISGMHYVGIRGLRVPQGHIMWNPYLVALSCIICWVVCVVGCILLLELETNIGQQMLFSTVATCGVAAMHFTGMGAATFYSYAQPTADRGYPPSLATAIAAIAISTCLAANLLLAHSATVSRNKLAEIVWTRRKLWMAIAQKETAESAAAARSEFIASASHEIRTPLHHLQGYSDLLSRTELTEEGKLLLFAIQRATKTLSLITNNVLDWSRLEKDGEATCRPVSLDLRTICESIITLLPNQDEEADVELIVVVAPNVPASLFVDETYIHRILMNLLSNALKFTSSGYILLSIEMENGKLIASVNDTGCGVPPTFLPQLFEPFKQAQVRGRARGTGLGLSIIKQLLDKMNGTIDVNSKYQDEEDVGPEKSGSTFTVTIPVHTETNDLLNGFHELPRIAIFPEANTRAIHGLKLAWEKFGFEVILAEQYDDIAGLELKYVWADLPYLQTHPQLLRELSRHSDPLLLVPYDTQTALDRLVASANMSSQIVPIQRPLLLHTIKKIADAAALQPGRSNMPRAVRFDPVVTELDESQPTQDPPPENLPRQQSFAEVKSIVETVVREPSTKKGRVILLVEDNPINCKLGKKMLQSLGYQVIIAEDGVFALERIVEHDADIDAILMDQSMPRMDGCTATKEIRRLESEGKLSKKRPIIAVSAVVSTEAQILFKDAGANDFLAKPLSLGRLESTLATHLGVENSV